MTSRWRTYAVPLDGRPWTAVSDHRVTIFSRGEAPGHAPLMTALAPHLAMALAADGAPVSRESIVELAIDGRCRVCKGAREVCALVAGETLPRFAPCRCNDDPIRLALRIARMPRGTFDLRLIAVALSRLPPGDVVVASPERGSLVIRCADAIALVMGLRATKGELGAARVWEVTP